MDRLLDRLGEIHARVRRIAFLHYYTWFVRIMLALAFLPSGYRKIMGDRFTKEDIGEVSLMFDALYDHFGALYFAIGLCQVVAAVLLLVPRTAALGALVYLPISIGIVIVTTTLDFGAGTPTVTSLLLLGTVYLLCWDWHRVVGILAPARLPAAPRRFGGTEQRVRA
ncbi:putative membrane protein YphA (DoxX/SURF4 family) [Nocardiopsis mwathae]|uniref:Putative membrane protein YphA (DoxX/SURF4 family) n=1 Tax=Nocardiopsis mwathae TaxID=1472723 RepID=A0A7W9YM63_9ACTN|nr:DoxX family membrane protein [Nocardiopsis mwathae]MBB6173756.1 putative membrane protein YphA (DoxX/SURF4 family) [Nocardiopsis mwathae]